MIEFFYVKFYVSMFLCGSKKGWAICDPVVIIIQVGHESGSR